MKRISVQFSVRIILFFLFSLNINALLITDAICGDESGQESDTLLVKRPVMHTRSGWEKIAFIPGHLVYIPIKYTLKGMNFTVGYIDETKLIPRIEDFLTSDDERRGVKPTYAARSGGGLKFYQKGLFVGGKERNVFETVATAGEFRRQRYQMTFENIRLSDNGFFGNFLASYVNLSSESFYGIGPDSELKDESGYALESSDFRFTLSRSVSLNSKMNLNIGSNLSQVFGTRDNTLRILSQTDFNYPLWGMSDKIGLFEISADYSYDSKDRPGNPTDGTEALFSAGIFPEFTNNDKYGFYKYTLDVSKIIDLFYERVLVLRIASENIEAFTDKTVPFYRLSELGEKESIRGFSRGRYRDMDKILASAEYRYPVWRNWMEYGLDISIFIDAGQVSPDIYRYASKENFAVGYGFGFRFWDEDGLVGKLEAGWSKDEIRIYVVLN